MGFWDAVASAGPYANNLHLALDRQPHQHLITHSIFFQAGCSSWCSTNSVKALRAIAGKVSKFNNAVTHNNARFQRYRLEFEKWNIKLKTESVNIQKKHIRLRNLQKTLLYYSMNSKTKKTHLSTALPCCTKCKQLDVREKWHTATLLSTVP